MTWIPCSERMPPLPSRALVSRNGFVLLARYGEGIGRDRQPLCYWEFADGWDIWLDGADQSVTHWMPLPAPPTTPQSESRQ